MDCMLFRLALIPYRYFSCSLLFEYLCVFVLCRNLEVPAVDDHTSPTNTINTLVRLQLGEVVVQISKSADKIDTPYLMLRINRLCVDVALTAYGLAVQSSLGAVQLVDKIHTGQ